MPSEHPASLPGIRVHQWLSSWDEADFKASAGRRKPEPYFYILSMSANDLRALSGIYRREAKPGLKRDTDLGIQRRHDPNRSHEISEFVSRGFPWSTLSATKRKSGDFDDLIKPGWLPTGIVVNILTPEDEREGTAVHPEDQISVELDDGDKRLVTVRYPDSFDRTEWSPKGQYPIEVIDGQHRLWSFSSDSQLQGFELPVIAFYGLDIGWQAYLFYTINIKPKRIDTSLAYDLYPLLRTADWLERAEEHHVYRETRAQELVEALWSFPDSPWHNRIDMLGDSGRRFVTQAAWVRSLTTSFVKAYEGRGVRIGGLFGAEVGAHRSVLPWTRTQQAAFLIFAWQELASSVRNTSSDWTEPLRGEDWDAGSEELDPAFAGDATLLNTDQGVRGFLRVVNDLTVLKADDLGLAGWSTDDVGESPTNNALSAAIADLGEHEFSQFVKTIAESLADWDWRTSRAPGLTEEERQLKARFRGGTGYKEIRLALLKHLARYEPLKQVASQALEKNQ